MSAYRSKPWLSSYDQGLPADITPAFSTMLEMFEARAALLPHASALHYFHTDFTFGELDRVSNAVAVGLQELGLRPGGRVAILMQNVPQFVISLLATWKAGAIGVPLNPMLREREVKFLLTDSGAEAIVALESLYGIVAGAVEATEITIRITTSDFEYVDGPVPPSLQHVQVGRPSDCHDLLELAAAHEGERPASPRLTGDDVAFLAYTSGTTGPPKGALNTHANAVFNSDAYARWMHLNRGDVVLGVSPLCHITGLVAHVGLSFSVPIPLVLAYRFDAGTILELVERYRATFTVATNTVFFALLDHPCSNRRDISSLRKVMGGGIPSTDEAWERRIGTRPVGIYGMTEATSPMLCVPSAASPRVDETSGAVSVGVPIFGTVTRILDDDGNEAPVGEAGEIVTSGPQIVPGYWKQPEETRHAFRDGEIHTGDIGFMDSSGWFYIVDRKKEMINAAGFKVWPAEVESVLNEHPAVREAAVIGVPDEYRGETVKAFVSLKGGSQTVDEQELIDFCRQRMAAYKYPRHVEFLDDLPKTGIGKIVRRELRNREIALAAARRTQT